MATGTENCPSFFDCDKAKGMSLEQVIKDMIIDDGNGCPVWRGTSGGGGGGGSTSTQRTPSRTKVTASGAVAAGARSVTLEFSLDFVGSVLGSSDITPGGSLSFSVNQNDDTLGAIAYTITAGHIIINKVV